METIQNPSFQSLPQELGGKLQQLIAELAIEQLFFHAATAKDPGHLVIISASTKNVAVIEARKWLRNLFKEHRVLLHVLSSQQMRYGYKNGNPFIPSYCIDSAKVYQNNDYKFNPSTTWKCFKKRYKKFERDNFYEHDVLMTMNNEFYVLEARTSVFLTYITLYQHHLTFLEKLYIGHSFYFKSLPERIKYLSQYLPEVEGLFVKQNGATYYLIAQLEKAKQAAEEADEMYINWDLYDAISEVEIQLKTMMTNRFLELKKKIKANKIENSSIEVIPEPSDGEKELSLIVSQILKIKQPEEIFFFHKTQTASITNYYLLLIGEGLGTEILNNIQNSIKNKFNNAYSLVLIGHSRFWIQEDLYTHQGFFKNIMITENLIYQSPCKNFTMHWENSYTPNYGDLDYIYRSINKMISNYFVLREFAEKENTEGIAGLFSNALFRCFRSFVFAKLSYEPHYISSYNLWMLCLYAQPNLGKIEYLFEKLSDNTFFKMVDFNVKFHCSLNKLPNEKLLVMDEILNVLTKELKTAYETTIASV